MAFKRFDNQVAHSLRLKRDPRVRVNKITSSARKNKPICLARSPPRRSVANVPPPALVMFSQLSLANMFADITPGL